MIHAAIRSLLVHYRARLILPDLHGYFYSESAHVLAVPEGTVKSRIHGARQWLRQHYGNRLERAGTLITLASDMIGAVALAVLTSFPVLGFIFASILIVTAMGSALLYGHTPRKA